MTAVEQIHQHLAKQERHGDLLIYGDDGPEIRSLVRKGYATSDTREGKSDVRLTLKGLDAAVRLGYIEHYTVPGSYQ